MTDIAILIVFVIAIVALIAISGYSLGWLMGYNEGARNRGRWQEIITNNYDSNNYKAWQE